MKLSKILLVLSCVFFFNAANALEVVLANVLLTSDKKGSIHEKLDKCITAEKIRVKAINAKVELEKVKINFRDGNDKNVHFLSTLERDEITRWRDIGFHGKNSCIDNIVVSGYSKHTQTGYVQVLALK